MHTELTDEPIRILIVDDHALLRSGLRGILEMEDDLSVIGEASNGTEAIAKVAELRPDVVLMDINMPEMNGLEATQIIRERHPDIDVIGLTIHDDDAYIFEMVNAGAQGYVLKDSEPTRLVEAIRRVRHGGAFMPADLMVRLFGEFRRLTSGTRAQEEAASLDRSVGDTSGAMEVPETSLSDADAVSISSDSGAGIDRDRAHLLSEREQEVLRLIVQGNTNREIGAKLFISEKTVKNHITNLLRKLDLDDRTQAAVYAIRAGLVRL